MSEYTKAQSHFFFLLCRFGLWLEAQGYQVSEGEGWRTPEQAALYTADGKGILLSLHRDRMAQDLIIRDQTGTEVSKEEYSRCGAAWKALDSGNAWGGDFKGKTAGDLQHFSHTYGGRS
jgi:hypothetical protein